MTRKKRKGPALVLAMLVGLTSLFGMSIPAVHATEGVNLDLTLNKTADSVKAGQSAVFELDWKISGAHEEMNAAIGRDSSLTVWLPVADKDYYVLETPLEELKINEVVPVYDEAAGTLTYIFPEILTGFSVRKFISLVTTNGTTPTGKMLPVRAKYVYNAGALSLEDDDVIQITSGVVPTLHKELARIVDDPAANAARPGYEVIYRLDASVALPNGDHPGSRFLEPGSDIVITDILDSRLTYLASGASQEAMTEAGEGLSLTREGQKLTWTFQAASLEDQKAQGVNVFATEFFLKVRVSPDIVADTRIDNTAAVTVTGLGEGAVSANTSNTVTLPVLLPKGATLDGLDIPVRTTSGPGAGNGIQNPNKGVDINQGVSFTDVYTGVASGSEYLVKEGTGEAYPWEARTIMAAGYQELVAYYSPSDNINLRSMHLYLPFAFVNANARKELSKVPTVTATFLLEDGTRKDHVFDFSDRPKTFAPGNPPSLDLAYAAMGLAKEDKVKSFYMTYRNADGSLVDGEFAMQLAARYDIMPGTEPGSRLEQKVEFVATLADGTQVRRGPQPAPNQYEGVVAERYDTLVAPQEVPPTVEQVAMFMNTVGSEVKAGDNRVLTALSNYQSASTLGEYPHSIVVLPLGVTIKPNHADTDKYYIRSQRAATYNVDMAPGEIRVFSDDYMGSGHQAILVEWKQETLMAKERLVAEFDVVIDKCAPDLLALDSYGFAKTAGDKMLKRKETSPIVVEQVDLNGDGITGRDIATSHTTYTKKTDHDLKIEKFVKGSLDTDFSKFGYATPGGSIEYKLTITNTSGENIYKMGFLDILPAVGDLEVIKNSPRNSAFTPSLSGPIQLPDDWASKVEVFYSTEANPTREEALYSKVTYPANAVRHRDPADATVPVWMSREQVGDWSAIRSFKVELQRGDIWVKGQNLEIRFQMTAPQDKTGDYLIPDPVYTSLTETYPRLVYAGRAAWNSFAMTTNGTLPTEPERVGLVILDSQGAVRAEYYIVNTDKKLQDDKQIKNPGTPVGTGYSDTPPEEITGRDGKVYRLVKGEDNTPLLKEGSHSPKGLVERREKVIQYQYRLVSGGRVSVKYLIEGTEITLENPAVTERDEKGNYLVKKANTEIGTGYDTVTDIFQPETLMKEGKKYRLTARQTAPGSDPVTGQVQEQDQLILYEYRLVEEPEAPKPQAPKPESPQPGDSKPQDPGPQTPGPKTPPPSTPGKSASGSGVHARKGKSPKTREGGQALYLGLALLASAGGALACKRKKNP